MLPKETHFVVLCMHNGVSSSLLPAYRTGRALALVKNFLYIILGARLQGPRLLFGGGYGVRSQLRIRFEGGSRQIGFIDTFLPPVCRRGTSRIRFGGENNLLYTITHEKPRLQSICSIILGVWSGSRPFQYIT